MTNDEFTAEEEALSPNSAQANNRRSDATLTTRQNILVVLGLVPAILVVFLANNTRFFTAGSGIGEQRYADVDFNSPFYIPAERLTSMGMITSYPCGGPGEPCDEKGRPYFRWGQPVKRSDLARLLIMADDALYPSAGDRQPVTGKQSHADVPADHPYYEWIEQAANRGFMQGYPCGGPGEPCDEPNQLYFRPDAGVSRAELAFSIYKTDRKISNNPSTPRSVSFQDVPQNHPYWLYVERMYERGIMTGYICGGCSPNEPCVPPDNRKYFRPDAPVTNGQVARAITNALLDR